MKKNVEGISSILDKQHAEYAAQKAHIQKMTLGLLYTCSINNPVQ